MPTVAKVLLAIGIVFGATILLLALTGVFIARNIHVQESGNGGNKTVSIETPVGNMTVHANNQLNPEAVGIPVYPGATRFHDKGGADFQIDAGGIHKEMTVAGATYNTPDSPEKVEQFYQHEFPTWNLRWENDAWRIESKDKDTMRTVIVKREGDHTRIAVASFGKAASN